MYSKIYNWIKTFLGKILAILAGLIVFMTFIDFLLKWQIYPYLFSIVSMLFRVLYEFAFESFVLVCLALLVLSSWRLHRKFVSSKPNVLEKQIVDIKTSLETQIKKSSDSSAAQVKSVDDKLSDKIFEIERTLVDFEIENHRSKNQVGEISKMIKKLNMDIKRKWGVEDTLLEIKEYIKKKDMPNYYFEDLHNALKNVPGSLKMIADEILKLAQEKLYNPR
ncbi:TPA: hypothetical protein DEX28_01465 [Patescibacteria group bacterium]|nr:hypothetical protein [Patescibacteria group bacterium]